MSRLYGLCKDKLAQERTIAWNRRWKMKRTLGYGLVCRISALYNLAVLIWGGTDTKPKRAYIYI